MKPWPKDVPPYFNTLAEPCDMWDGPCCCGALHQYGEFEIQDGQLYHCDRPVVNGRMVELLSSPANLEVEGEK